MLIRDSDDMKIIHRFKEYKGKASVTYCDQVIPAKRLRKAAPGCYRCPKCHSYYKINLGKPVAQHLPMEQRQ